MTVRVCVIGIGNTLMGDDGVGVRVADELGRRDYGPDVRVVCGHTAGMALVEHLLDSERVIFVDAIDAGDTPGSVFRFDPAQAGLPAMRSHTSHGLSIPALLQATMLMGKTPEVVIYAIQVGHVHPEADSLTAEVAEAAAEVAELIDAELRTASTAD